MSKSNGSNLPVRGGGSRGVESPYIKDGNWWVGGYDTGVSAHGLKGDTPYVGSNSNWWISGKDLGVKAVGVDGAPGPAGAAPEFRWAKNGSVSVPPSLDVDSRNPAGWSTDGIIADVGEYVWETYALINSDGSLSGKWSSPPIRKTGSVGTPGDKGQGINIKGEVAKYEDLPTSGLMPGDAFLVREDGRLYVWDGTKYPPKGQGIKITGDHGQGYEFNYIVTNVGASVPSVNSGNWSPNFPDSIGATQTLWMRMRTVDPEGPWKGPIKMTGDDGTGKQGPSMAYRGDWSNLKQYSGSDLVVHVVKYVPNGRGYISRTDAGDIPVGTLPTNTNYWNEFALNADSIIIDFLFAYSGYIGDLTVGVVQTAVPPSVVPAPLLDAERFTAGYKPTDANDPTRLFSKHSPRLYYPSGRILWTSTFIPDNAPVSFDNRVYRNMGAQIFYKDEPGSPISSINSVLAVSSWTLYQLNRATSDISGAIDEINIPPERFDESGRYLPSGNINAHYYDPGIVSNSSREKFFEGFHTNANKGMGNFISDGWYNFSDQVNLPLKDNDNVDMGYYWTRFIRIRNGKITYEIWYKTSQTAWSDN